MNIKIEIDNEKYEIAVVDYSLPTVGYEDWGYEIFDISGESPVSIGDETDYADMFQAATQGLNHLLQILTNEDHSDWYTEQSD